MRVLTLRARLTGAALFIGLAAAAVAIALLVLGPARGADHTEAPGLQGDPAADITDIFAFRSAENSDNLVVVINVNPLTVPADNASANFATDVDYEIHVDNTGDLVADATVNVTFSGDPLEFTLAVEALGLSITGPVTPPSVDATAPDPISTESGGIKVFAGQRDDPFFFDAVGFTNFVAGPFVPANGLRPAGETPADTFAGTNISAIVIELPITALTGAATSDTGTIRAWATTSRGGARVDRMAIPTINTALIPSDQKDAFNQGDPANDVAAFGATAQATIEGLRAAVDAVLGTGTGGPLGDVSAADVAATLIPDVVTIDFSQPVQFTNGRTLEDDVIDVALGVVLNQGGAAGVSDAINGNDVSFLSTFPFLAPPHQPQATPTPAAPPPTGGLPPDGGDGLGWPFLAAIALGGLLAVTGAGVLLRRRAVR